MPVRSSSSSLLKWPTADEVVGAAADWASRLRDADSLVLAVGYFGSYSRGDWGLGSDLDLVVVLSWSEQPRHQRSAGLALEQLPVPAEALVYTLAEWLELLASGKRMAEVLQRETVWFFGADRVRSGS